MASLEEELSEPWKEELVSARKTSTLFLTHQCKNGFLSSLVPPYLPIIRRPNVFIRGAVVTGTDTVVQHGEACVQTDFGDVEATEVDKAKHIEVEKLNLSLNEDILELKKCLDEERRRQVHQEQELARVSNSFEKYAARTAELEQVLAKSESNRVETDTGLRQTEVSLALATAEGERMAVAIAKKQAALEMALEEITALKVRIGGPLETGSLLHERRELEARFNAAERERERAIAARTALANRLKGVQQLVVSLQAGETVLRKSLQDARSDAADQRRRVKEQNSEVERLNEDLLYERAQVTAVEALLRSRRRAWAEETRLTEEELERWRGAVAQLEDDNSSLATAVEVEVERGRRLSESFTPEDGDARRASAARALLGPADLSDLSDAEEEDKQPEEDAVAVMVSGVAVGSAENGGSDAAFLMGSPTRSASNRTFFGGDVAAGNKAASPAANFPPHNSRSSNRRSDGPPYPVLNKNSGGGGKKVTTQQNNTAAAARNGTQQRVATTLQL